LKWGAANILTEKGAPRGAIRVDRHLERLRQEIESAVAGLSAEQLSAGPPGKWCAAEILEHLYLTYTGTTKGFERLLQAEPPPANRPTWQNRFGTFVVVGIGYFPKGRKSPPVAKPRGLRADQVRSEIAAKIREMDEVMTRCEAKFGPRRKVLDHPLLGPFSVAQWRKFHLVHGLHHVKQIRLLKASVIQQQRS
jgi:hypothetical protein